MSEMVGRQARRWDGVLRVLVWGGAAVLLSIPAVAMQLGAPGVNWTASDFVFMGVLLLMVCGACELALRASGQLAYRAAAALAIGGALLMVWIDLAVGIIDGPNDNSSPLFAGVVAVGVLGAIIARGRAPGMARAMSAAAAAQALVAVGALVRDWGTAALVLSAVFGGAWLLSAWLFQTAARSATAST